MVENPIPGYNHSPEKCSTCSHYAKTGEDVDGVCKKYNSEKVSENACCPDHSGFSLFGICQACKNKVPKNELSNLARNVGNYKICMTCFKKRRDNLVESYESKNIAQSLNKLEYLKNDLDNALHEVITLLKSDLDIEKEEIEKNEIPNSNEAPKSEEFKLKNRFDKIPSELVKEMKSYTDEVEIDDLAFHTVHAFETEVPCDFNFARKKFQSTANYVIDGTPFLDVNSVSFLMAEFEKETLHWKNLTFLQQNKMEELRKYNAQWNISFGELLPQIYELKKHKDAKIRKFAESFDNAYSSIEIKAKKMGIGLNIEPSVYQKIELLTREYKTKTKNDAIIKAIDLCWLQLCDRQIQLNQLESERIKRKIQKGMK